MRGEENPLPAEGIGASLGGPTEVRDHRNQIERELVGGAAISAHRAISTLSRRERVDHAARVALDGFSYTLEESGNSQCCSFDPLS